MRSQTLSEPLVCIMGCAVAKDGQHNVFWHEAFDKTGSHFITLQWWEMKLGFIHPHTDRWNCQYRKYVINTFSHLIGIFGSRSWNCTSLDEGSVCCSAASVHSVAVFPFRYQRNTITRVIKPSSVSGLHYLLSIKLIKIDKRGALLMYLQCPSSL